MLEFVVHYIAYKIDECTTMSIVIAYNNEVKNISAAEASLSAENSLQHSFKHSVKAC